MNLKHATETKCADTRVYHLKHVCVFAYITTKTASNQCPVYNLVIQ